MKVLAMLLTVVVSFSAAAPITAQQSTDNILSRAYALRNAGDTPSAIALLKPNLAEPAYWSSGLQRGKAWNLLGAAYQDIGMFADARRCHEIAVRDLQGLPDGKEELASALDNLGSVEDLAGSPDSSRSLREAAHRLYEELGDHAGLARTSNSLATIALGQGDLKTAKRYAASATEEARRAPNLDEDDRAALDSVAGTIALRSGSDETAAQYFSKAIGLWVGRHGQQYWMVCLGYSLRAQAYGGLKDRNLAFSDIDKALEIAQKTGGKTSTLYWRTELLHAALLSAFGDRASAARLDRAARNALIESGREQCNGCLTTAAGLQSRQSQ